MKTLIEIHAIQNFAPSNLNRDDTGAPKDAFFGGTRRARISSQCLKRAAREYFKDGVRTKRIQDELVKLLVQKGYDEGESAKKTAHALMAVKLVVKEDGKTEYLLFLGRDEIAEIAAAIDTHWKEIVTVESEKEGEVKKKKKKGDEAESIPVALKNKLEGAFNGGNAIDVALFGRMLADMPEHNQYAACQVAHALSTHTVEREFDFYTAVDDLKPDDTAGADMMGTVEFNSACFYRYAVVDWDKLVENLQGDWALATKGLRAFLEGFVVAEPTGKQNTFAAHNPPEFVAVSVRHNTAPRSLTNAFETAIRVKREETLTKKSAEELVKKAKTLQAAYGGEGTTLVLNLAGADIDGFGTPVDTLAKLLDQTLDAIKE